jgi:membrane-associated protease RseP (regulator of RpoE activity)
MSKKIYLENIVRKIQQPIDEQNKEILNIIERYTVRFRGKALREIERYKLRATRPTKKQYIISVILFLLTFFSTTFSQMNAYRGSDFWQSFLSGLYFSLPLMGILLFHELGHFFVARRYRVYTSPPYFIPMPFFSIIGTLGAIIIMRDRVKSRKALIDIGFAGPFMSFILSIPFFIIGIMLSKVSNTSLPPPSTGGTYIVFGDSLITYFLMKLLLYQGANGSFLVEVHPFALAGWVGFFVTGLNLIPVGQLDGGHIAYALFGRKYNIVSILFCIALMVMGIFWIGWFVWGFLMLFVLKPIHPHFVFKERLDKKRKIIGLIAWMIFLLTFVPIPIRVETVFPK